MPGLGGIETLDEIMRLSPATSVIMITAYGELDTAIRAFRKGAYDYLMKPVIVEDVLAKIQRLVEHRQLSNEVQLLRRQLANSSGTSAPIGQSDAMKRVMKLVDDVCTTRSTVLLAGESGTGKEVVARAVHEKGGNRLAPFIPINCAGISESLLESELFGHVKGAFTGAVKDHTGYFELAGEGTVLLDEIGEMPVSLQSKLLRVLEQKEFYPVGSARPRPLAARIIASTNQNLKAATKDGRFREDLYFRLAVFEIDLPPLRQRRSDIPLLVEYFLVKVGFELKRRCMGVSREAMRCLMAHSWPGNVRELRNVIERAMIVNRGDYLQEDDLPDVIVGTREQSSPDDLRGAVQAYEREFIRHVLAECGGNKEEAARRLNINPSTLYRKLAESPAPAHVSTSPAGVAPAGATPA